MYYEAVVINGHELGVSKRQKAALSHPGGRKSKLEVRAEWAPSGAPEDAGSSLLPRAGGQTLRLPAASSVYLRVCVQASLSLQGAGRRGRDHANPERPRRVCKEPPHKSGRGHGLGGGQGRLEGAVQPGTVFSSVSDDFVLRAEMCGVCRVLLALPGHKTRTAFFFPQVQRPDVVFPFSGGLKMSNDVSKTSPKDLFVLQ